MSLEPEFLVEYLGSQDVELHKRRLTRIIAEVAACKSEENGKSQKYVIFCFNFIRSLEALLSSSDASLPEFLRGLAEITDHPVFELALAAAAQKLEQKFAAALESDEDALPEALR